MPDRAFSPKKRILIVDDDSAIRYMLSTLLKEAGHETVQAEDAGTALDLIRIQAFDLVVTDHDMPGRSGVELIRAVLADSRSTMPAMVLFTGHGLDTSAIRELRTEVHGQNAVYFMEKGKSLDDLQAVLDAALGISRKIRN